MKIADDQLIKTNTIILGVFFCFFLVQLLHWLPRDVLGGGITLWVLTDWLIDYSSGFTRRGLSGELVGAASTFAQPRAGIGFLSWLVYGAVVLGYLRLCTRSLQRLNPIMLAAMLFLPCLLPFYLYDHSAFGRKESIGFLILLWHLWSLESHGNAQPIGRSKNALFQRRSRVDLACLPMVEPDEEGGFLLLYDGIPYACMGVARREAGEALGWFDEGYRFYAADPDFSLRLILSGRRLAPVFGPPLVHHKHPDGARHANRAHLERDNRRLQEIWTRRMKRVRRSYRRGSSRYFRGLETRWSEAHQTDALDIPGSDADRPLNPRRPHELGSFRWWAPWR